MFPTSVLEARVAELLSTDTDTLAPAALALKVHLVTDEFSEGLDVDFADRTPATFTGSAAKTAGVGPQQSFFDPVLQQRVIQLLEPVGGWHWQCTVAPDPQQQVTGYVVTNNDDSETYGSKRFPAAVPITNVGDGLDIGNIQIRLAAGLLQPPGSVED
jgi:hypothetical protein